MRLQILVLAFAAFASAPAQAISGYLSLGFGSGGTRLSNVTGGQDYQVQAGSGLFMTGGALFSLSPTVPHRFEMQLGLGYLFQDDARQKENRVSWSRIPIEAIYLYRHTQSLFRLGWGATYHMANKISAKGSNATAGTNVDDSLGWIISGEKLFASREGGRGVWSLGLRYLWIDYKSSSFSKPADGNSWFLTLSLMGE